jgi:hypothetical protein
MMKHLLLTKKETDPVAFEYILRFINIGRLLFKDADEDDEDNEAAPPVAFEHILRILTYGWLPFKDSVELVSIMEILLAGHTIGLYHDFYDKLDKFVKQLSEQDYKDVVESLKSVGDDPNAISIQRSLASAYVEYSRSWLVEHGNMKAGSVCPSEAVVSSRMLQSLLAESLVIPGWEHEDESPEPKQMLIELLSVYKCQTDQATWRFIYNFLQAIEVNLDDDIIKEYTTAVYELHLKDISVHEGPVGLSAKAFVIILKNTLLRNDGPC